MSSQCTNHLLMIKPVRFGYNPETATDNAFQAVDNKSAQEIQDAALAEFNNFVHKLKEAGVNVHVVEDTPSPHTPDSVFPNNWISFHEEDSTVCIHPMASKTRRLERKATVLQYLENNFEVKTVIDFSRYEQFGKYLEGTGSMVLDRENRIVYAAISGRTDEQLFEKFCTLMGYKPFTFHAQDESGNAIYHTNVMMSIADRYAIVCFDTIQDPTEREDLEKALKDSGKTIIKLVNKQMHSFAGNMLQVQGETSKLCVMSTQAYESLDFEQIAQIEEFDVILHSSLETIETSGGGSARCMMAEIFLPLNTMV